MSDADEPDNDLGPVTDPGTGTPGTGTPGTPGGLTPGGGAAPPRTALPDRFWWVPYAVGLGVLVAYGLLLSRMFDDVSEKDPVVWGRMIYLFAGVESLAFAAAGFFFGREVNRGRAEAAETRAEQQQNRAARAETYAATKKAQGQVITERLRELTDGAGAQADPASLRALADEEPYGGVDPRQLRELARLGERWFYR